MVENNDLEFEGQESPDTEFVVDPLDENSKSITYGLFSQLCALQNFYSRIQSNYKKVALTWLIAALIGIGYIFSKEISGLPFHRIYIAIFVSLAGMCGITLLWFIDIIIYQTYFYGVVVEQFKLEKANLWLPRININTGLLQFNAKTTVLQGYFYIGCNLIFLLIIMIMSLALVKFDPILSVPLCGAYIFSGWIISFFMKRGEHPKKHSPLREEYLKKIKS
jgi:hypothetical protein